MGALDERGINIYVPPRYFPFPVHYLNPSDSSGNVYYYTSVPSYSLMEIRVYLPYNFGIRIFADDKELPTIVSSITTRYVRSAVALGYQFPDAAECVAPFDVPVLSARYVSQNPDSGSVSFSTTLTRCVRALCRGPINQLRIEYDFEFPTTIEIVGLDQPLNFSTRADQFSLRRVKWAIEGEAFVDPQIYAAASWLLVIDATRQFVYNIITEEVVDIFPLNGTHASGPETFYVVDAAGNLYSIAPPYDYKFVRNIGFVPDTSINGSRLGFVKFYRGVQTVGEINYSFEVAPDTSYVYNGATQGRVSQTGQLVFCVKRSTQIEMVIREPYGYVVAIWDLNSNPPPATPDLYSFDLSPIYPTDWFENFLDLGNYPITITGLGTRRHAVGFAGNYWLAYRNGSEIQLFWLEPDNPVIATDWVNVSDFTLIDQTNAKAEVSTPTGTIQTSLPVFIVPDSPVAKFKSFFDIFPNTAAVRTLFGSGVNAISIVKGPYYEGGIDWRAKLGDLYPGVTFNEIEVNDIMGSAGSTTTVYVLTPGTIVPLPTTGTFLVAALIPFTAGVAARGGTYTLHGLLVYQGDGTVTAHNCLGMGVALTDNNSMRVSGNNLVNASGTVGASTPTKIASMVDVALISSSYPNIFVGPYGTADLIPVSSIPARFPIVVGKSYRLIAYYYKGLVVFNSSSEEYSGPLYLETDLEEGVIQFEGGITGYVVTASSGKRYIFIPQITIPGNASTRLKQTNYDPNPSSPPPSETEDYFYSFKDTLLDTRGLQSWAADNAAYFVETHLVFRTLTKQLASVGTIRLNARTGAREIAVKIDDVVIGWIVADSFLPAW